MENINNNQNNDNKKKEYKKIKICSTICSCIIIVGYIMVACLLYALFGLTIATIGFCFTYLL